ncbi:MAG: hypothetical protein ACPGJS_22715 [Flammeovirgaceae bacterium]
MDSTQEIPNWQNYIQLAHENKLFVRSDLLIAILNLGKIGKKDLSILLISLYAAQNHFSSSRKKWAYAIDKTDWLELQTFLLNTLYDYDIHYRIENTSFSMNMSLQEELQQRYAKIDFLLNKKLLLSPKTFEVITDNPLKLLSFLRTYQTNIKHLEDSWLYTEIDLLVQFRHWTRSALIYKNTISPTNDLVHDGIIIWLFDFFTHHQELEQVYLDSLDDMD